MQNYDFVKSDQHQLHLSTGVGLGCKPCTKGLQGASHKRGGVGVPPPPFAQPASEILGAFVVGISCGGKKKKETIAGKGEVGFYYLDGILHFCKCMFFTHASLSFIFISPQLPLRKGKQRNAECKGGRKDTGTQGEEHA